MFSTEKDIEEVLEFSIEERPPGRMKVCLGYFSYFHCSHYFMSCGVFSKGNQSINCVSNTQSYLYVCVYIELESVFLE